MIWEECFIIIIKRQYFLKISFLKIINHRLSLERLCLWRIYARGCLVFTRELCFLQFEGKGIIISAFLPGIGPLERVLESIESKHYCLRI